MEGLSQLEQLQAVVATHDLSLSESVDTSKYLDEDEENGRFEKPATNEEIRQRERDIEFQRKLEKILLGLNTKYGIETLEDEYSSVALILLERRA